MDRAEAVAEIRRYGLEAWRRQPNAAHPVAPDIRSRRLVLPVCIASAKGRVEARFWESRTYRSALGSLRALALFGLIAPIVIVR